LNLLDEIRDVDLALIGQLVEKQNQFVYFRSDGFIEGYGQEAHQVNISLDDPERLWNAFKVSKFRFDKGFEI
jgi:hypothetical protein